MNKAIVFIILSFFCSFFQVYGQKKSDQLKQREKELVEKIQNTKNLIKLTRNSEQLSLAELGIIQHQIVNNLPLGRNVDEALRMVDALQHHEEEGEVCPANWEKGKEAMKENFAGVADYLSKH